MGCSSYLPDWASQDLYRALAQAIQQLLLDGLVQLGRNQCLCLTSRLSLFHFLVDRDQLPLGLPAQFAHANKVLGDLCEPLLALVDSVLGPVHEVFVNLCQGLETATKPCAEKCGKQQSDESLIRCLRISP